MAMPLFHLHLWEGGSCLPDDDGAELADVAVALALAKRSLSEMLADDVRSDRTPANRCIVITDESGSTIAQVTTAEVIESLRAEPPACPAQVEHEFA